MKTLTKSRRPYKANRNSFFCPRLEPLEIRVLLAGDDYFSQAQNGNPPTGDLEWINGILNNTHTTFFEGMATLQRLYIEDISGDADSLTPGNQHVLKLEHNAESQGAHAYDYLVSWEQALAATALIAPGAYPDPITNALACKPGSSAPSSFEANCLATRGSVQVPIDDDMDPLLGDDIQASITAFEKLFDNRTLTIYGDANISDATMVFDGYNAQNEAQYTLTFTSDSTFVGIEFAAHISQGHDFLLPDVGYGAGRGAGSINGGNYHVQLISFDGASTGSQDNQLQANAVAAPPDFTIDKTGDDLSKAGDDAAYSFTVTHTGESGSADLQLVSIVDDEIGDLTATAVANGCSTLSPGDSCSFDVTFTIPTDTLEDPFVNEVTAVYAIASLTSIELTRTDTHSTNLFQPGVVVDKTAISAPSPLMAGDTATYEVKITNVSSADSPHLIHDSIIDTKLGTLDPSAFTESVSDDNILEVGEVWTGQFDYVIQPGDVPSFTNTVTVHFHPDGFPNDVTDNDSVTLAVQPPPDFTIVKNGDTLSKIGDDVTYTFTITHTGPANSPDLTLVSLTDDKLGVLDDGEAPVDCDVLSPTDSCTFDVTFTIPDSADDPFVNTVTAVYKIAGRDDLTNITHEDTHSVNLFQPAVSVDKSAISAPDPLLAGDTVTYEIKITNASSADSPNLIHDSIVDTKIGTLDPSAFSESKTDDNILEVGEVWTGQFGYVVQVADFPSFTNTVTIHFHPENFSNDLTDNDSVTLAVTLPVDGRMTGGGSVFLPATGAIPDQPDMPVRHGFQLHCYQGDADDDGLIDANNRLEVNWGKPNSHFHLFGLNTVACMDTPIVQAPPDAPIDTMEGTGVGRFSGRLNGGDRLNNVAASLVFTLTDGGPNKGEPGLHDTAKFVITADTNGNGTPDTVVLDTNGPQLLQSNGHSNGNHQSHEEIPPLRTSESTVSSLLAAIDGTLNKLDNPNLSESKINNLTITLLDQFDQLEAILDGSALTANSLGDGQAETLILHELQPILREAIAHWRVAGADPQLLSTLDQLSVRITNLPGNLLGLASEHVVWIDQDAAGHGWSVELAPGRMDLRAAVTHELGHVLGFEHSDRGIMAAMLPASSDVQMLPSVPAEIGHGGDSVSFATSRSLLPSSQESEIVAALETGRLNTASHPVAIVVAERPSSTLLQKYFGSSLPVAPEGAVQPVAPYVLRPKSDRAVDALLLDYLFDSDDFNLAEARRDAWSPAASDRVAAVSLPAFQPLFNARESSLLPNAEMIDRVLSGEKECLSDETPTAVERTISTLAAAACAGYFLGCSANERNEQTQNRGEKKSRLQVNPM